MNTIMIENMIHNQGYKVHSFDTSISRRRSYISKRYDRDRGRYISTEDYESDQERLKIVLNVNIQLQDPDTDETVVFNDSFTDVKAYGDCVKTLGEIFEKHDDVLYKEV